MGIREIEMAVCAAGRGGRGSGGFLFLERHAGHGIVVCQTHGF
jgi:hypothetical protein